MEFFGAPFFFVYLHKCLYKLIAMVTKKKQKPRAVISTSSNMRGKTKVKSKVNTRVKTKRKPTISKKSYGTLTEKQEKKILSKNGATLTTYNKVPISKRTYELETKRKGSVKGYGKTNGKYYKVQKRIT